jgi:hypothetical protein
VTAFLPEPVPLDMPPGNPEAVEELDRAVAGAAFRLAALGEELGGPAASAPGWLGDDAAAAAAQVDTVAGLARDAAAAVRTAAGRLSAHGERLRTARRQVAALRAEQDEDHRAAWAHFSDFADPAMVLRIQAPAAVAVVEELQAAEAARRRRHSALLEEVVEDAAATARVLEDSSRVVGGKGRPGDEGRVIAYLAAELPGWGEAELAGRGAELAREFQGLLSPEEREALARRALACAGSGAFAAALLEGLGEQGVRETLALLGDSAPGAASGVAGLLAAALGAAVPTGAHDDPLAAIVEATYVDPDDSGRGADLVAVGMGVVLAAGLRSSTVEPRPTAALAWGRQILDREYAQAGSLLGVRAVDRAHPGDGRTPDDPMAAVADALVRAADPSFASALLGERHAWEQLLSRSWDDATDLARLVIRAADDGGAAGDAAVRAGLSAVGGGLFAGDPAQWTVDRGTVAAVAGALGEAVAAHVPVAVSVLEAVGAGEADGTARDVARGLGHLTIDRQVAATVEQALGRWALLEPVDPPENGADGPSSVVAVSSAYVAVQEYGQRLAHALHGFEGQEAAETRQQVWKLTVGLAVSRIPGPFGIAAGLLEGYAAIWLDMDGTWDNGVDRGLSFDRADAARAALAAVSPEHQAQAHAAVVQARAAYDRATGVLGRPAPPVSPETDYLEPVQDAMTDVAGERGKTFVSRTAGARD